MQQNSMDKWPLFITCALLGCAAPRSSTPATSATFEHDHADSRKRAEQLFRNEPEKEEDRCSYWSAVGKSEPSLEVKRWAQNRADVACSNWRANTKKEQQKETSGAQEARTYDRAAQSQNEYQMLVDQCEKGQVSHCWEAAQHSQATPATRIHLMTRACEGGIEQSCETIERLRIQAALDGAPYVTIEDLLVDSQRYSDKLVKLKRVFFSRIQFDGFLYPDPNETMFLPMVIADEMSGGLKRKWLGTDGRKYTIMGVIARPYLEDAYGALRLTASGPTFVLLTFTLKDDCTVVLNACGKDTFRQ